MNKRIILFIVVLGLSLIYLNLNHYINSPSGNSHTATIIIPKGYSVKKIAKELEKQEVISHQKLFWLTHRFLFKSCPLQAGEYEIPAHSSIKNIINYLHEGKVVIHKFTILEGTTTKEIIDRVTEATNLTGEITHNFNEGDFLANTYNYTYGDTKMNLLNRIYSQSQNKIEELWQNRSSNLPFNTKEQAVTLASIIEKETGLAEERKRVAAVFINRLRKNMRLQADPTVIYAVTLGQYSLDRPLSKSDLRKNSPYNTYLYPGLPPAPICNPGQAALEAALHPMDTKELYFVVDGAGGHNFSATLNEHNQNVINYRKQKSAEIKNDN